MSTHWVRLLTVLFIAVASPVALGGSFLTLTATTTSGPPMTVTASGSDLTSLVQNAIQEKQQFAALAGNNVTASLTYGGVQRVITVTRNAAGTSATLSIPSIGVTKTFTGANARVLANSIHTELRSQPDNAVSKLNQDLAGISKWGVVDGNPSAATAFAANDAFYRWGLPQNLDVHGGIWAGGSAETIHADGKNGSLYAGAIGADFPISQGMSLSIDFAGNYREVGGARSFTIAESVWGLPIDVYKSPLLDGFEWKLTPYVFGSASFSKQLLSGGGVYGAGGVSSLTYRTGPFAFILADEISYNSGLNASLSGVHYGNSDLNSTLVKNGVQVVWSPNETFFADAGIAYTNFLQDAAVKNYWSPSVGAGCHLGSATTLRVGLRGDYANGYTGTGADISLSIDF
ncbi:MAG TPA: hypothetical protein VK797_27910 [Tepidisphaeraceae bacterium]|nr:hypothetical protein [Tepidisphaeraceae bacterium]